MEARRGESMLVVATSVLVAACLAAGSAGRMYEALVLCATTVLSVALDAVCTRTGHVPWPVRRTTSPGVHLGAVAMQWLFAAQLAGPAAAADGGFAGWALGVVQAGSAGMLVYVAAGSVWNRGSGPPTPTNGGTGKAGRIILLACLACAALLAAGDWGVTPTGAPPVRARDAYVLAPGPAASNGWALLSAGMLHGMVWGFPASASLGEAMLIAQSACVMVASVAERTYSAAAGGRGWGWAARGEGAQADAAAMAVVAGMLLSALLCSALPRPSSARGTSAGGAWWMLPAVGAVVGAVELLAVPWWLMHVRALDEHLVPWAVTFVVEGKGRVLVLCFWAATLAVALPLMQGWASGGRVSTILLRKGFHALAVALFAPVAASDPPLLRLALGAALALLILAELLRLLRAEPVGSVVGSYIARFTDARDAGPLVLSHASLLLGCAAPLWLCPSPPAPPLAPFAGILSVGVADAAASAVGRKWGRRLLATGSSKTVEGTLAGMGAALVAAAGLRMAAEGSWAGEGAEEGPAGVAGGLALAAATGAMALMEALTSQLDNAFVPLHYAALLCLLPALPALGIGAF